MRKFVLSMVFYLLLTVRTIASLFAAMAILVIDLCDMGLRKLAPTLPLRVFEFDEAFDQPHLPVAMAGRGRSSCDVATELPEMETPPQLRGTGLLPTPPIDRLRPIPITKVEVPPPPRVNSDAELAS